MNYPAKFSACLFLLTLTACSVEKNFEAKKSEIIVSGDERIKMLRTKNIEIIEKEFASANKNTLFITDITDVLLEPKSQLFKTPNEALLNRFLNDFISKGCGQNKLEREKVFSIVVQQPVEPVDENFVRIIRELQERNVKVLALTNGLIGSFGYIDSMEDFSIQQLNDLGYHLENSWSELKSITLTLESGKQILFKNGVIFVSKLTSKASKGECLLAFLEHIRIQPKKIIFVDDKRKNLESVAEIARKIGARFVGIEYTGALEKKNDPISDKHAQLQLSILEKEHKLLSDDEIESMLR